jgi:hypothetical protein
MRPPYTSGFVTRCLLDGPNAEQLVEIEIEENVIIGAINIETGKEINPNDIGPEDYGRAIEYIQHYGN